MPRKARRVESALLAKVFRRIDSKHRKFFYVTTLGSETPIYTLLSQGGNRDIEDGLLSRMARQCGLSRREFLALIDCPLTQDDYEALLVERGAIDPSH